MTSAGPADRGGRQPGLDGLKGLAIVLVVLIHAAPEQPAWYTAHFVGGFSRLAVPVFLVITGFLAGWKAADRRRFQRQALTFLRLHVVYGVFYWGVNLLLHGSGPLTPKSVLLRFGEAAWPGQYYLVVLVQTFVVAGVLLPERFWHSRAWLVLSGGAAVAGLGLVSAAADLADALALPRVGFRILATASGVWLWFFYFALGAALGARRRQDAAPPLGMGASLAALGAALALATSGFPHLPDWGDPERYPYARLSVVAGTTLVALVLPRLAPLPAPAWLARLGVDSFGIYVLNPALLMTMAAVLGPPLGVADSLARAGVTIAVALPLVALLRRYAPIALP